LGLNEFECGAHADVRAAPRELCRERSKIGSVLAVKGIDAQTMLLDIFICSLLPCSGRWSKTIPGLPFAGSVATVRR